MEKNLEKYTYMYKNMYVTEYIERDINVTCNNVYWEKSEKYVYCNRIYKNIHATEYIYIYIYMHIYM